MAWLVARNVGEMLGGRLRSPVRAVWGGESKRKRPPRPRDAGAKSDAESLKQFAQVVGAPWTPAPAAKVEG